MSKSDFKVVRETPKFEGGLQINYEDSKFWSLPPRTYGEFEGDFKTLNVDFKVVRRLQILESPTPLPMGTMRVTSKYLGRLQNLEYPTRYLWGV